MVMVVEVFRYFRHRHRPNICKGYDQVGGNVGEKCGKICWWQTLLECELG